MSGVDSDFVAPARDSVEAPLLVRALRGEPVERPPVWFMRQAGRSLPEYRALRKGRTLLELARTPELAAEVTLQPVRRHGVDAAILFSDIVLALAGVGIELEIRPGVGPVIAAPVRTAADIRRLRPLEPDEDLPEVGEAVRLLCAELDVPLIGFAGGPFTLASYLIEGGPSKAQARTKAMMLGQPALFRDLLDRLAAIAAASLRAQARAGAAAVQVFESWIGFLSRAQYERHVAPPTRALFDEVSDLGVPRILFGVGAGHLLEAMADTGPDTLGLDWRTPLSEARHRLGPKISLQGNLDPAALLAPWASVEEEARSVLAGAPATGYVFNLGHGVLPDTPPDVPGRLVELVHEHAREATA
ncbi:MAG TPA: uroporphyrinogen decarboxylase [Solirubrobacteraceae bacterium]|jgi:uroporphyrinogen decarboxylase